MQTKIKKWGNSLALRIPKSFALNANLRQDELVDISVDKERIIITPIGQKEYSLDELLAGVSEYNLHGEVDTGVPVDVGVSFGRVGEIGSWVGVDISCEGVAVTTTSLMIGVFPATISITLFTCSGSLSPHIPITRVTKQAPTVPKTPTT